MEHIIATVWKVSNINELAQMNVDIRKMQEKLDIDELEINSHCEAIIEIIESRIYFLLDHQALTWHS